MIEAVLSMSGLALAAGIGLGLAAARFRVQSDPLAEKLLGVLPGSNCGNCGYPGCQSYADALAASAMDGNVAINLCTPGGAPTIKSIADLLGVDPVEPAHAAEPRVAMIDEVRCIGCTACIKACPVDAIVGANKQSHTVIVNWCTDCEACVEPCPVDCIEMVPLPRTLYDWKWDKPAGPHARSVN